MVLKGNVKNFVMMKMINGLMSYMIDCGVITSVRIDHFG